MPSRLVETECPCYPSHVEYAKGTKLSYLRYAMIQRCEDVNSAEYHNYGGRGIKVCPEWRNDVYAFINWAKANGYKEGLQIDRRDNDGDYTPENCRFVTPLVNSRNSRRTKLRPDMIPKISALIKEGRTNVSIAGSFNVSPNTISGIRVGKRWADCIPQEAS